MTQHPTLNIDKKRNTTRIILIISSAIFGVLIFPNLGMAMFSAMLFDSPGSDNNSFAILLAISILSYTPITLVSITLSWIFFSMKRYLWATISAGLPFLVILLGLVSILLLSVFCGGDFSC